MIGDTGHNPILAEAERELEAAIHDARVAFDCIGLGETDRAHTSAVTARVAIDAAVIAIQGALTGGITRSAAGGMATGPETEGWTRLAGVRSVHGSPLSFERVSRPGGRARPYQAW